jgi:threonine synthase
MTCPHCGDKGILDIVFNYSEIKKVLTRDTLSRDRANSIWRYKPLLPVKGEGYERYLRVGWSPFYRSNFLEKELGIKALYIKDDGINPTGSLKDRASCVAAAKAHELGYETIACSSTGNAASSLAGNAARLGLKSVIFVPQRAPEGKVAQLLIFGAKVISVIGDYRDTFNLSKAAIDKYGWYNRNAGINPIMVEGKKTVALEIAEQLDFEPTDWVAVSVGDGCTIGGVHKGFKDLYELGLIDRIPKILGVQSTGCSPFVDAAVSGCPLKPAEEDTLADSIAVGIPRNPVKAQRAVSESGGGWLAVSDDLILDTMRVLGRTEGVFSEPAGAAATAGVRQAVEQGIIKPGETVTTISTGSGLKDVKNALRAAGKPNLCEPNLDSLEKSGILL